jgi:signal transduction histidine kinase
MKLLPSFSFRLVLLYMVLFSGSVVIIGGLYYWITVRTPLLTVQGAIEQEARDLARLYQAAGRDAVVQQLEARAARDSPRLAYHALLAPDGTSVAANLPTWPRRHSDQWLRMDADVYDDGQEFDHEAMMRDLLLDDGARLLVGSDIEDIDEVEEKLLTAVVGLVTGTLILGLVGGLLLSHAIGRRIATVTRTARGVMGGDLSDRMPVRGSGDDFDQLNTTLNDMLARIETLFDSVRRVSDNVAHELRTPLSRLRASLEPLRDSQAPPAPEIIDGVIAEVETLEKTFDAVLRIARIESGRHGARIQPLDLAPVLRDAVELYAPEAEQRQQSLQLDIGAELTVPGDRDLLFQSVCNLLDNAIKYAPQGGRILLAAHRKGPQVELAVTDDGPGIAAENRPHVIERFYRVLATADAPGAGLGLSLVAAVAERHRSTLVFEDAAPGLAVRWTLPAA